jgi:predicted nucleic acid-binding protein
MRKLFIDTNIIIDVLGKRIPFYESAAILLSKADRGEINVCISALSIVNTHNILSRTTSSGKVRSGLYQLKTISQIVSLNDKILDLSLNDSDFRDFEDAVQHYSALESKCDVIITRNKKDFVNASLPVMVPEEYLELPIN